MNSSLVSLQALTLYAGQAKIRARLTAKVIFKSLQNGCINNVHPLLSITQKDFIKTKTKAKYPENKQTRA